MRWASGVLLLSAGMVLGTPSLAAPAPRGGATGIHAFVAPRGPAATGAQAPAPPPRIVRGPGGYAGARDVRRRGIGGYGIAGLALGAAGYDLGAGYDDLPPPAFAGPPSPLPPPYVIAAPSPCLPPQIIKVGRGLTNPPKVRVLYGIPACAGS